MATIETDGIYVSWSGRPKEWMTWAGAKPFFQKVAPRNTKWVVISFEKHKCAYDRRSRGNYKRLHESTFPESCLVTFRRNMCCGKHQCKQQELGKYVDG